MMIAMNRGWKNRRTRRQWQIIRTRVSVNLTKSLEIANQFYKMFIMAKYDNRIQNSNCHLVVIDRTIGHSRFSSLAIMS